MPQSSITAFDPSGRLGNIIKTADKIYTDAADAADRIHTGADFVSQGRGAKGPVAKIDVREELLRQPILTLTLTLTRPAVREG